MSDTEPTTERLAELYASGMTIDDIAQQVGMGWSSVRLRLVKQGVQIRSANVSVLTPEEAQRAQELHAEGLGYLAIAQEVGRPAKTVRRHLLTLFPDLELSATQEPTETLPNLADAPGYVFAGNRPGFTFSDSAGRVHLATEHPSHPVQLLEQITYWRGHAEHYRTRARAAELRYPIRLSPSRARDLADRLHDLADQMERKTP